MDDLVRFLQKRPVTPGLKLAYKMARDAYMRSLMPKEKHTFAGQEHAEPEKPEVPQ